VNGTARVVACTGCQPTRVTIRAHISPAGCGANAITSITTTDLADTALPTASDRHLTVWRTRSLIPFQWS